MPSKTDVRMANEMLFYNPLVLQEVCKIANKWCMAQTDDAPPLCQPLINRGFKWATKTHHNSFKLGLFNLPDPRLPEPSGCFPEFIIHSFLVHRLLRRRCRRWWIWLARKVRETLLELSGSSRMRMRCFRTCKQINYRGKEKKLDLLAGHALLPINFMRGWWARAEQIRMDVCIWNWSDQVWYPLGKFCIWISGK